MFVHDNIRMLRYLGAALVCALTSLPTLAHQPQSTEPVAINAAAVTATGTVTELTVRNQLTGETLRYFGLKLDSGASYALTGTGLDMLASGTRINATGTLSGNVFNITLFSVVATPQTTGRATAQTESKKAVLGTVALFHKDFFEQGKGEYGLALRDAADKTTQLNVAAIPDSLSIGMRVSADGQLAADGTSLDVSTITILGLPPVQQNGVAAAPVTNNVLVLPIKFTDTASEPFSVAQITTEFQTKVMPYYQEVSYGQQLLSVTVANKNGSWLNAGVVTPSCDYTTIGNLADAAATAAGYNINSYQNRYYVMPSIGCGWAGLAYVGWGRAWSNGVNALWVYGHELGHNFGLYHAGSVNCGSQVLGGSCGVVRIWRSFRRHGQHSADAFQRNAKVIVELDPGDVRQDPRLRYSDISIVAPGIRRPVDLRDQDPNQQRKPDLLGGISTAHRLRQPPFGPPQPGRADPRQRSAIRLFEWQRRHANSRHDARRRQLRQRGAHAGPAVRRQHHRRDDQRHQRDTRCIRSSDGFGRDGRQAGDDDHAVEFAEPIAFRRDGGVHGDGHGRRTDGHRRVHLGWRGRVQRTDVTRRQCKRQDRHLQHDHPHDGHAYHCRHLHRRYR